MTSNPKWTPGPWEIADHTERTQSGGGGEMKPTMLYPRIWITPDGTRIEIYSDRKERTFMGHAEPDKWILYRRDVPGLTDDEWYGCPIAGSREIVEGREQ